MVNPSNRHVRFRHRGITRVDRVLGMAALRSYGFPPRFMRTYSVANVAGCLPAIYSLAGLLLALGIAARLVPSLEQSRRLQWFVQISFPLTLTILLILAVVPWAADWVKQSRSGARPLPSPASPNLLLVVLDTVAATHLNLHGYGRATSTTLLEFAERGICFNSARATSSWTLPSHATIFTGRWMHELSVGWLNPLDKSHSTLAEFLSTKGYATAGFVANTVYCARDSGLSRGFNYYQDYIFPGLTVFKLAIVIKRTLAGLKSFIELIEDHGELAPVRRYLEKLWALFTSDRKGAAVLNREFLRWLARRTQPERPFFVFLNYADAHTPYQLPPQRMRRFGVELLTTATVHSSSIGEISIRRVFRDEDWP